MTYAFDKCGLSFRRPPFFPLSQVFPLASELDQNISWNIELLLLLRMYSRRKARLSEAYPPADGGDAYLAH